MEFLIYRQGGRNNRRWVVHRDTALYGEYLNREQALLDAVDAARDAQQSGEEARVFLRENKRAARIY